MEKSLILIKPDAVERNLIGNILSIYEGNGLKIVALKMVKPTIELGKEHYAEHVNKSFFHELIKYITRSSICALIVEGENAINKVREINGATDPSSANKGTIREKYAISKNENSVHASDSSLSAEREIKIWFPEF